MHAEGLTFDGAEGAVGLSKHTQFGLCVLDKLVRVCCIGCSSRSRRRRCHGNCFASFFLAQFTALQLVCQFVGFLTHGLQLVSGQGAPAPSHVTFLELRLHVDRDALLCVRDCTHKHLVFIFLTIRAASRESKS